jgi:hypothetical protein
VKDLAAMTGTATAMTPNDGNTSKHAFAPSVPFHRLGDTTANVTLAVQSHNFSLWRAEVASAISVHDFYVSVGAGSQTAVLVHNCPGSNFSQAGKQQVWNENAASNDGVNVCSNCGQDVVSPEQSQTGVSPPSNEGQVDHIFPRSLGGEGDPENGQLLCRACNLAKGNQWPWP